MGILLSKTRNMTDELLTQKQHEANEQIDSLYWEHLEDEKQAFIEHEREQEYLQGIL